MNLERFLKYFLRAVPDKPKETTVRFAVGDREFLSVQTVEFDVEANAWTIRLAKAAG